MAKVTRMVSDLTGEEIQDGSLATMTIRFSDARRGIVVLDVSEDEVEPFVSKGRKQSRRGRPASSEKAASGDARRKAPLEESVA